MAELTTEYLDKKLEQNFGLTKEYLDQSLDRRFNEFEAKFDHKLDQKLAEQTQELKKFTEEQVDDLAAMVARNVVIPLNRLENRVDKIDTKFDKLEESLHIKL